MVSKKAWLKLLVSSMLILSSTEAQDIDSGSVIGSRNDRICQLAHPNECQKQFEIMNKRIDKITLYLDYILTALKLDSLHKDIIQVSLESESLTQK